MSKQYQDELESEINYKTDQLVSALPEFCSKFFDHMKTIDRSARTRLQYAYDLQRFFTFEQNQAGFQGFDIYSASKASDVLDRISYEDVQEYFNTLNEHSYTDDQGREMNRRYSQSFKARNISTIRSFWKFYYTRGEIEKDLSSLMEMPKMRNVEKFALDASQVQRILNAVDTHENGKGNRQQLRDKAILTLLFGTGIRVSELVGIDIQDVDFYNASILITRKGGDQDVVFFSSEVENALRMYLDERRSGNVDSIGEQPLFLSNRGSRLSVRMVQELVGRYARESGINANVTPHSARRTLGTFLYENTNDIYLVADTLHHKSIQTTRRYAKMSEDHKRKAQALSSDLLKEDK